MSVLVIPESDLPKDWAGKLNIYVCESCHGHIVTRDRDAGVTPFLVACKCTPGCTGFMKSSMYRVFDQSMAETHEWYRPDNLDGLARHTIDHVRNGGLLLRPKP